MVHSVYHLLCPECAEENLTRRAARCDLRGRRALITGGRVKIGFQTALKLLRDGAEVLVTTRFPADASRRFAAVPDAGEWLDRLHVHGVDLLDLPGWRACWRPCTSASTTSTSSSTTPPRRSAARRPTTARCGRPRPCPWRAWPTRIRRTSSARAEAPATASAARRHFDGPRPDRRRAGPRSG